MCARAVSPVKRVVSYDWLTDTKAIHCTKIHLKYIAERRCDDGKCLGIVVGGLCVVGVE